MLLRAIFGNLWCLWYVLADDLPCRLRVAHCIVGHVRTFWQESVYQSIADVLVARASPFHCADFFYVLGMSSNLDTFKGGVYDYNETLLWNTAWKVLPPTKYLLEPPPPTGPRHTSYHQPDCLFQCAHMFDKVRLCLELVRQYERETGQRYAWIVRSRPDLQWAAETEMPSLEELSNSSIYTAITRNYIQDSICKDPVQIVPRGFAEDIFDRILDTCLLRRDLEGEIWNCDTWIQRFCDSRHIPITLLRLIAMIHRLPSIKDNFFDYHDQWYQHVRFAQQLLPDSIFILGNEDEGFSKKDMKWSNFTTSIPAALEPQEGCITVADSQFCMPVNAYLIHLRFAINTSAIYKLKAIHFGLWRTYPRNIQNLRTQQSKFRKNASHFWFRIWFPEVHAELLNGVNANEIQDAPFHYNLWTPVLLRRGDCIFWTSCASKEVSNLRFPDRRRHLLSESRVLAFPSGTLPAAPQMRHTAGPFHAVQPRHHSSWDTDTEDAEV
ncbi:unnamed protein product [Durusdinium trenchii]|uniref:Uncharacterized protein n=1 Tax=Durusdinium trenchii TaxID=1381693 RepID=A0ABP0Q7A6_9DINO